MIHPDTIADLRGQIKKGDLTNAAQIYHERFKTTITPRYLSYFIHAEKTPHKYLDDPRKYHSPLRMYEAIAEAVAKRQARERAADANAKALFKKIIQDTTPQKPIAL